MYLEISSFAFFAKARLTLQEFGGNLILIPSCQKSEEKCGLGPLSALMFGLDNLGVYRSNLNLPKLLTGPYRPPQ